MLGVQSDRWVTAGGVLMAGMGLARTGVGGPAVLRPPRPIGGPMWMVRAWGPGVLLGICMTAQMPIMLVGREPARPMTVVRRAVGPLLIISVTSAAVSQWWAGRQAAGVVVGRHK